MPFATKGITTASGIGAGAAPDGTALTFLAYVTSVKPIRALTVNNTSAGTVYLTLGEKATEATDFFAIPASTAMDFDVWELSDEDIHALWFASATALKFSLIYKYGPSIGIQIRSAPQGPKAAITA